jgi:hypothetical protein
MPLKEQSVKKQAINRYCFSIASIQSSKKSSNYNKIEIVTRHVYWGQEKLFEEKTRGEKSGGTVPLRSKTVYS